MIILTIWSNQCRHENWLDLDEDVLFDQQPHASVHAERGEYLVKAAAAPELE